MSLPPNTNALRALPVGRHHDGSGLYLQVTERAHNNGKCVRSHSWLLRFMRKGRAREMGLGSWPGISLATARTLAEDQRVLLQRGEDPIEVRRAKTQAAALQAARVTATLAETPGFERKPGDVPTLLSLEGSHSGS